MCFHAKNPADFTEFFLYDPILIPNWHYVLRLDIFKLYEQCLWGERERKSLVFPLGFFLFFDFFDPQFWHLILLCGHQLFETEKGGRCLIVFFLWGWYLWVLLIRKLCFLLEILDELMFFWLMTLLLVFWEELAVSDVELSFWFPIVRPKIACLKS